MKVKFYSIKSFLTMLLLLLGIDNTSFAQVITRTVEDIFLGSYTQSGSTLKYTYTVYNDLSNAFSNVKIRDIIPSGTTYIEESTEVNGAPWADVNGTSPIVNPIGSAGFYLPLPNGDGVLLPGETVTLTFFAIVNINAGAIKQYSGDLELNFNEEQSYSTTFPQTTISIVDDISCTAAYITHGATATTAAPNSYISSVNISSGSRLTTVFNGISINNYYANTNTRLPIGSRLLTDASAIAFDNPTQRIYFVNNSTTDRQELYYVSLTTSPVKAYKFSSTTPYYLNTNTGAGYNITRMTFTPSGVGYALTDNAQELIRFSVIGNVPTITNLGPVLDGNNNGAHIIGNETGGDICADYSGNLWLVTNAGNIYTIFLNGAAPVAGFYCTPSGLPTDKNNSIAIGPDGKLVVSGGYQDAYKIDLANLTATSITEGSTTNVFYSGDYASCYYPLSPVRKVVSGKPAADKPNTQEAISKAAVRVSPNPFVNSLSLQVALPASETVKVRLIDMYGRTVYATTEKLSGGINTLNLNIPGSLGRGIYILDLFAGNKRLMQKKLSHL